MARVCEGCGYKMPAFRPRHRAGDGKLVCDGCIEARPNLNKAMAAQDITQTWTVSTDDGWDEEWTEEVEADTYVQAVAKARQLRGIKDTPLRFRNTGYGAWQVYLPGDRTLMVQTGSIETGAALNPALGLVCEACGTPMGDGGLIVEAGMMVCADGCPKAGAIEYSSNKDKQWGPGEAPPFRHSDDPACPRCGSDETWMVAARALIGKRPAQSKTDPASWQCANCELVFNEFDLDIGKQGATPGTTSVCRRCGQEKFKGWFANGLCKECQVDASANWITDKAAAKKPPGKLVVTYTATEEGEYVGKVEVYEGGAKWYPYLLTAYDRRDKVTHRNVRAATLSVAGRFAHEYLTRGGMMLRVKVKRTKHSSLRAIAHDSGDGQTLYHCPVCGSGQVTGRSDGTAVCGYCQTAFTVQVQPMYSDAPQTDPQTGEPIEVPGMPGSIDRGQPQGAEGGEEVGPDGEPILPNPEQPAAPGELPAGAEPKKKNPVPPQFQKKTYFITATGDVLDEEQFQRHLAIRFADDKQAVLATIRAESSSRRNDG